MNTQRFSSTIEKSGRRAGVFLPFDPSDVWGERRQHHLTGTVNGHPVRGPLRLEQTGSLLVLGKAWLRDTGLEVGAAVAVELAPEGPQFDDLPADIQAALDAEPEAKAFFIALATFYRTGYLRWIDGARRPETRRERIDQTVRLLLAGRKQRK